MEPKSSSSLGDAGEFSRGAAAAPPAGWGQALSLWFFWITNLNIFRHRRMFPFFFVFELLERSLQCIVCLKALQLKVRRFRWNIYTLLTNKFYFSFNSVLHKNTFFPRLSEDFTIVAQWLSTCHTSNFGSNPPALSDFLAFLLSLESHEVQ